jgi:hypothetical protein
VIGPLREKRIGWIGIAWSCRVHRFYLSNARQTRNGRLLRVTDDMLRKSRMRRRKSAIQGMMTSQKKRDGFSPSRSRSNKLSARLRYAVEHAQTRHVIPARAGGLCR